MKLFIIIIEKDHLGDWSPEKEHTLIEKDDLFHQGMLCYSWVQTIFLIKMFLLFLVGWGTDQLSGFGEERGTKHQIINLIHSIRTVMRSKF